MSRILLLLSIIAFIYLLIRSFRRTTPKAQALPRKPEEMVRCAHCSVHLPKSEAVQVGEIFYCSEAHYTASKLD